MIPATVINAALQKYTLTESRKTTVEECISHSGPGSVQLAAQLGLIVQASWAATASLLLLLSRFSRVRLCATPQTAAHQASPSRGFSRQEHWSGLQLPSPTASLSGFKEQASQHQHAAFWSLQFYHFPFGAQFLPWIQALWKRLPHFSLCSVKWRFIRTVWGAVF